MPPKTPKPQRRGTAHRPKPATVRESTITMGVTIVYDAPRTPDWDALWRRLLRPLPDEVEAGKVA